MVLVGKNGEVMRVGGGREGDAGDLAEKEETAEKEMRRRRRAGKRASGQMSAFPLIGRHSSLGSGVNY